jgi:hypothetical protein
MAITEILVVVFFISLSFWKHISDDIKNYCVLRNRKQISGELFLSQNPFREWNAAQQTVKKLSSISRCASLALFS